MNTFSSKATKDGFTVKLWRGERMCLIGFDVTTPEPDFVGFSIEFRPPGSNEFFPLKNRLAFSYDTPALNEVTGARKYDSTKSPFQTFRWVHFPHEPKEGTYTYRATKMHMPQAGRLDPGTALELDISLDPVTYHDFLDVGFSRNFASSQAYAERYKDLPRVPIPDNADGGLAFEKLPGDVYQWLGFEVYDLIFGFLKEAIEDPTISVDALVYDFNEPDLLARFEQLGSRLRIIIDDSSKKDPDTGAVTGHGKAGSAESKSAARLKRTAGGKNVQRTHFQSLQHNKVFIAKRNGVPFKVLAGSANFSFRGLYIQANNVLVFNSPEVGALYGRMFELAFADPAAFSKDPFAATWHAVQPAGRPAMHFCFSPHKDSDLSLNPVRGAIDQATSSVLYSVAFLNQIKSGPTKKAFDRLVQRPVFSYGIADKAGNLEVRKPDGSVGLVDFAYLAKNAPPPFSEEWSGGKGINIHHKFVVTDFSLPTAKVFTGSSNLAPSGEEKNGDNLIMIEDCKVATGYAIEALRVFDHLHFRTRLRDAAKKTKASATKALTLQKPIAISHAPSAWFEASYQPNSQKERDRLLFSI